MGDAVPNRSELEHIRGLIRDLTGLRRMMDTRMDDEQFEHWSYMQIDMINMLLEHLINILRTISDDIRNSPL